jgi:hypothetical protein
MSKSEVDYGGSKCPMCGDPDYISVCIPQITDVCLKCGYENKRMV